MSKYLVLIYGDESVWDAWTEEQATANGEGHAAFRAAAGQRVLGGHELASTRTATTLRADAGGRPAPTAGPFAETAEVLGGYYLVEADDLAEVVSLSGLLREASAPTSCVEVRPVEER
jgi:hypothetical protein